MQEPLIYPFRVMRITQRYDGTTSHLPHTTGTPQDFPVDEAGADGGSDPVFAPCDCVVRRIWGVAESGVNTLWVESRKKVRLANGKTTVVTLQLTHPNDGDLRRLQVGQTIKKGDVLCREGTDGANGNHIHLSVGTGKMKGSGWTKNSLGKWVLTTTGKPLKPEEAFFVDRSFTCVRDSAGLAFSFLQNGTRSCRFRVTAPLLRVRSGPGTACSALPFSALSADAQAQIYRLAGEKANGYVKGVVFTALEIQNDWAKTASGWVCLRYCEAAA